MGEPDEVRRHRELQRRLYGEPLGDRLRRLVTTLDVSQAALATAVGLSPAMLSQLMNGRRAKIGVPGVLERIVLLERRVSVDPAVATGDRDAVEGALRAVREATPVPHQHRHPHPVPPPQPPLDGHDAACGVLRSVSGPDDLARAADVLAPEFPALAVLLRRAAGR